MILQRNSKLIVLILGSLCTVTPFAIDLYLPAFAQVAADFNTTEARVALTLSSYFIGMAFGQIIYGPLLDRFGRKKPLFAGLSLFLLATVACLFAKSIEGLIFFRFIQALGGCSASVGAMSMVRDFYPVHQSAKIFSLLTLILGVSPLFAPTIGGLITTWLSWHWVFIFLIVVVSMILLVTLFFLPEGHEPDPSISLSFIPILKNFVFILKEPLFYTYAFAGSFSFAGLLVYVAGSPIIFMNGFHVEPQSYSIIFAGLATAFIGGSQLNILLSKKYSSPKTFKMALIAQSLIGVFFLVGTINDWYGLYGTIFFLWITLGCVGITLPNASALCLVAFPKNAGSASALMGFLQIGLAALASSVIGLFESSGIFAVVAILAVTSWIGLVILFIGKRRIIHVH